MAPQRGTLGVVCASAMAPPDNPLAPKQFGKVAVFCGASSGADPRYVAAARALGDEMARRGIGLVYGVGAG